MIAGNHEFYGKSFPKHLDDLRNEAASVPGVHLLENDIVEIGDVVFLGCTLWTDLKLWPNGKQTAMEIATRMNDYSNCHFYDGCQRRKLAPEDLVKKHLASVRWLREQLEKYRGRKLVVVTHHAPSLLSLPKVEQQDILAAAYASNLDKLVEESGALLWIHGHTHNVSDYSIGKTRVICNPVGYPKQQTGFDAEKVVVV
jgi:DNA repair exonuclease SbcCD nuclease subunit